MDLRVRVALHKDYMNRIKVLVGLSEMIECNLFLLRSNHSLS